MTSTISDSQQSLVRPKGSCLGCPGDIFRPCIICKSGDAPDSEVQSVKDTENA